jgi:ribokinase
MIAAPKVSPLDTVGAGDCFGGWLAAGLARGESFENAARRAVFAASLAVTKKGAQAAMPRADEVSAFEANAPNH